MTSGKTRNGGRWTEARFRSFIKSSLRNASMRWAVIHDVRNRAFTRKKTNAKTGRMAKHFKCELCGKEVTAKDSSVDHISPVVPVTGFTTWDDIIDRMFCEDDNLQLICKECHKHKCYLEKEERKKHAR